MLESPIINTNDLERDYLREAIKSYRDAMRPPKQDLDIEFFLKTLSVVSGLSPLKVARNPIGKDGRWNSQTTLYNVGGFEVGEKGLIVRMRQDSSEYTVEHALEQLHKLKRNFGSTSRPIMLTISEHRTVQITDIYSHAFVKNAWAGLPFDVVLGYFEKDPDPEPDSES